MKQDLIGVIETAYQPMPGEDQAWLRKVATAMRPQLDSGAGIVATFFDARASDRVQLSESVSLGCSELHLRFLMGSATFLSMAEIDMTFRGNVVVGTALGTLPRMSSAFRQPIEKLAKECDFKDAVVVQVADPTGMGFVFAAPCESSSLPSRQEKGRWSRVAAHLAAAYRLQRYASQHPAEPDITEGEAILKPDGTLEHAEAPAQDVKSRGWLRRAALAMDRARNKLRAQDSDEALTVWQGLVAGRWSLVDRFDRDGKRFLVARKNDPATVGPAALTLREQQVACYVALGHSNKLIAYELGISESVISECAKRARLKLGLRSRAELIQLLRGGGPPRQP